MFTNVHSTIMALHYCNPIEYTLTRHMHLLLMAHGPCQEYTEWLLLSMLQVGKSIMLPTQLSSSHSINMVGDTALGAQQSHHPLGFLHGWEEYSLTGYVAPNDIVGSKSVVGIKPGVSSVVIGYPW